MQIWGAEGAPRTVGKLQTCQTVLQLGISLSELQVDSSVVGTKQSALQHNSSLSELSMLCTVKLIVVTVTTVSLVSIANV